MALSKVAQLARELTMFIHSRKFTDIQRHDLNATLNLLFALMTQRERNGYWNWLGSYLRLRPPLDELKLAQKIGKSLRKST